MSNVDRPFGARVVQAGVGSGHNARVTRYEAEGELYVGSFVKLDDGKVKRAATNDDFVGVVVGIGYFGDQLEHDTHGRAGMFNPDNLTNKGSRKLPLGEDGYAWVVDDPNAIFEVQAGDGVTDLNSGSYIDINNNDEGNDLSGRAETVLSGTTNNDLVVVNPVDREDNDSSQEHAVYLVRINPANHIYAS